jgi:hypothetical protein
MVQVIYFRFLGTVSYFDTQNGTIIIIGLFIFIQELWKTTHRIFSLPQILVFQVGAATIKLRKVSTERLKQNIQIMN